MKLSAAIRIGSMTTKQITGKVTDGLNGRCALGAAIDATGTTVRPRDIDWLADVKRLFPILSNQGFLSELAWKIITMNDTLRVSREAIADYVERIENEMEHDGYLQTGVAESQPLEQIAMEAK